MTLTPDRALDAARHLILDVYRDLRNGDPESAASKVERAAGFVDYARTDEQGTWQGRLDLQGYWQTDTGQGHRHAPSASPESRQDSAIKQPGLD